MAELQNIVHILYRSASHYDPLSLQESANTRFASMNEYFVGSIFTCFSAPNKNLKQRKPLIEYISALPHNSRLIAYDAWVFSEHRVEILELFRVLFERSISIYFTYKNVWISRDSEILDVLRLFDSLQDLKRIEVKQRVRGRPQGGVSLSKYEPLRIEILRLLQANATLSEISRRLGISRSSLGDYVKSRKLKDIANEESKLSRREK